MRRIGVLLAPRCRWAGLAVVRDLVGLTEAYTRSLYEGLDLIRAAQVRVLTVDGAEAVGADGRRMAVDAALGETPLDALYIADFEAPRPGGLGAWRRETAKLIDALGNLDRSIPTAAVGTGVVLALEAGRGLAGPVAAPPHLVGLIRDGRRGMVIDPTQTVVTAPDLISGAGLGAEPELALALFERCLSSNLGAVLAATAGMPDRPGEPSEADVFIAPMHQPDDLVAKVCRAIRWRFAARIELKGLAAEFGVTPRTLTRRFQTSLGMGPKAYQQHLRIAAARVQLERTTRPVARIAALVGYLDTTFFVALFKARVGVTPLEYRRQARRGSHP